MTAGHRTHRCAISNCGKVPAHFRKLRWFRVKIYIMNFFAGIQIKSSPGTALRECSRPGDPSRQPSANHEDESRLLFINNYHHQTSPSCVQGLPEAQARCEEPILAHQHGRHQAGMWVCPSADFLHVILASTGKTVCSCAGTRVFGVDKANEILQGLIMEQTKTITPPQESWAPTPSSSILQIIHVKTVIYLQIDNRCRR